MAAILAFANKFLLTSPLVAKCLKLKDKTFKEMRLLILFKINTLNFSHKGSVCQNQHNSNICFGKEKDEWIEEKAVNQLIIGNLTTRGF